MTIISHRETLKNEYYFQMNLRNIMKLILFKYFTFSENVKQICVQFSQNLYEIIDILIWDLSWKIYFNLTTNHKKHFDCLNY